MSRSVGVASAPASTKRQTRNGAFPKRRLSYAKRTIQFTCEGSGASRHGGGALERRRSLVPRFPHRRGAKCLSTDGSCEFALVKSELACAETCLYGIAPNVAHAICKMIVIP